MIAYKAEGTHKDDESHQIKLPKISKWKCIMFSGNPEFVFQPEEGQVPNWFHRKMQGLILGHKWINTEQAE